MHVAALLVLDLHQVMLHHSLRRHRTLADIPLHLSLATSLASRVMRSIHPNLCKTRQRFSTMNLPPHTENAVVCRGQGVGSRNVGEAPVWNPCRIDTSSGPDGTKMEEAHHGRVLLFVITIVLMCPMLMLLLMLLLLLLPSMMLLCPRVRGGCWLLCCFLACYFPPGLAPPAVTHKSVRGPLEFHPAPTPSQR